MACEGTPPYITPPLFSELGQSARNLFNANYFFGIIDLHYRGKAGDSIEIEAHGTRTLGSIKTESYFTGKFEVWGCKIKEKWHTENIIETSITTQDMFMKGLNVYVNALFAPHTGKLANLASIGYRVPNWNVNLNLKSECGCVEGDVSAIGSYNNWIGGGLLYFNASTKSLGECDFAFGYLTQEFALITNVRNCTEFSGSLYNHVNERYESAVQLAWSSVHSATRFGLCCVYKHDILTSLAIKINNLSQLGVSFSHKISPCLTFTVAALVNCKNLNEGGHKIGFGLSMDN